MKGVDTDGFVTWKPGPRKKGRTTVDVPALLRGSPPRVRGLWAKHLMFAGVRPVEVREILGVSKATLYRYLKLAKESLAEALDDGPDAEAA